MKNQSATAKREAINQFHGQFLLKYRIFLEQLLVLLFCEDFIVTISIQNSHSRQLAVANSQVQQMQKP